MAQSVSEIEHPTPRRHRVGVAALIFGFAAGPTAWITQLLINYGLTSYVCYPDRMPRSSGLPGWAGLTTALLALDGVALLVSLCGAAVSYRAFDRAREEKRGGAGNLIEVGEGRSRFLALCGLVTALGFFVVVALNTLSLILVPPCVQ